MIEPDENYLPEEEIIPKHPLSLDDVLKSRTFRILALGIFSLLLILIALSAFLYFTRLNKTPALTVTPTPQPVVNLPTPVISQSKWATDAGLLKEQDNLSKIDNDLKNIDLNEQSLSFPVLDFHVNFEKKN